MDIYTIYKITNRINDKVYIGFTSKKNHGARRWTEHKSIARNPNDPNHEYLHRAMHKYGVDNFTFDPIYQSLDRDHCLNVMEVFFINEYSSMVPDGYNVGIGGTAPMLGRKAPQSWHDKMKDYRHSDETRAKMARTRKGMKKSDTYSDSMANSQGHTWKVIHPDGREEQIVSMNRFCRDHGLTPTHMGRVAKGLQDNHKGYTCTKM